jgi:hypothetical protein
LTSNKPDKQTGKSTIDTATLDSIDRYKVVVVIDAYLDEGIKQYQENPNPEFSEKEVLADAQNIKDIIRSLALHEKAFWGLLTAFQAGAWYYEKQQQQAAKQQKETQTNTTPKPNKKEVIDIE